MEEGLDPKLKDHSFTKFREMLGFFDHRWLGRERNRQRAGNQRDSSLLVKN